MKKLVFAALAIGAMAACTKSAVQYEQPGEICLQPVAQKATKGAVDGTFYPTEKEKYDFNVWAQWRASSSASNERYIEQGTFTARDNVVWGGKDTKYYWPTTGELAFAGYSPASANNGTTKFFYDFDNNKFTVTDYIQSDEIDKTNDLMWFDFDGTYYKNPGSASAQSVPVTFKHALSWLTFKFNLKDESTPKNWVITNVKLQGIETKGNFVSTNPNPWGTLTETKEVIVYSGVASPVEWSAAPAALENSTNGVVIIPQSCQKGDAQLVLTYSLKKQGLDGYLEGQTVTLNLNTGTDGNAWLPGKHYIYTVIFGANEILISPSVTDWIDEEVDIDVQ